MVYMINGRIVSSHAYGNAESHRGSLQNDRHEQRHHDESMDFRLDHLGLGSSFFMSIFLGLVYGLAVLATGSVMTLLLDKSGILASVNDLLGSSIQMTPVTLYMMTALMAIAVTLFSAIVIWLKALLYDAGSKVFGGIKITLKKEDTR
jgi:hypothetical protein